MPEEIVSKFTFDTGDSIQKFGAVRKETRELKNALADISKEDPRWPAMMKRYADLAGKQRENARLAKALDPHEQIVGYMKIGEAGVGAFGAIKGSMALLGVENKDVLKSLQQIESVMLLLRSIKSMEEGVKTAKAMYQAMKLNVGITKAATVETKALGVANVGTAEATEGATVATKGLGMAMKAIGIGLIIAAVAFLIDNWKELKKEFQDLLPHVNGIGESFNRFKQIAVGVGSVVVNIVLVPIKELINGIGTMIKVFQDLKGGHFADAFTDIGNGVKAGVQIVKDGLDVVKHFKEGEAASSAAQAEDRRKEELTKEIAHYDDLIAVRQAAGEDTYKMELANLQRKKELLKDDEKATHDNDLAIEILNAEHHKKLAEEADKAAKKLAELRKKEAEEAAKNAKDLLEIKEELNRKLAEEQANFQKELLRQTTEFIQTGDELDKSETQKKIDKLKREYAEIKDKTMQNGGDLIAIQKSYDKQLSQLNDDLHKESKAKQQKTNDLILTSIEKSNALTLSNTKLTHTQKETELKNHLDRIKSLLTSGTIDQETADKALEASARNQQELDKQVEASKKASIAAIGGSLNALSGIVSKHSIAGKAIAMGQAVINTYQGATLALASAPPPFGAIEMGAVIASGLASVAKIAKTDVGGGASSLSIAGTGGAGLAFNAPSVPQAQPTTNLSQNSINQLNQNSQPQQTQVVVSESDISNTQNRVQVQQSSGQIGQ